MRILQTNQVTQSTFDSTAGSVRSSGSATPALLISMSSDSTRPAALDGLRRHHAAGTDHVGIQVIADPGETPMPGFRALAWQLRAAAVR